ncbi:Phosphonate-transporting ATPase [Allomuricauda ruestringensis DSM 13258]|uniref:Phosphonate-transporting ATPase n=1 Tax=Allomuricauda ruestringensis (strain DSM 13258 / CIP 107369 / LMG 19739 / B1) TaxID=886377 RepID=G2PIA8_ALLRU|nr:ABC transporter ATP-binding protein [Allomuricauda ruestringensis]AEM71726.1 Phosphonate-transporting ATPase [Allomuricauda ruestringensis DSM 13258]
MNTLKIDNVSLVYSNGYKALTALNLEINNGIFGLLGPNGAGKSSLMKTIVGLQKPTEGSISFNGVDIVKNPLEIQKRLGFLPQYFGVYPKVSAYNLLEHLAKLKGVQNKEQRHDQIMNLLEKVNLTDVRNKEVHTFSGGMKQRFGVAQALLGAPKIVIVDEPTAGLDPEERNRFNTLLSAISEDIIIILSTHLVEDVRNLCSQMAIIKKGQVISQGSPRAYVHQLSGKLWSKAVTQKELEKVESDYQVINKRLVERVMNVTVFADDRPAGFTPTDPSLEHAYFAHLNTTAL